MDAIYRLREGDDKAYLLRIADNRNSVVDLQIAVLDYIARTDRDLAVPKVRRVSDGGALFAPNAEGEALLAAFATSFLPGRPLAVAASPTASRGLVFAQLARLNRALDGFSHPAARRQLLWDVSNADRALPMTNSIPDAMLRGLARGAIEDWTRWAAPALPHLPRQVIHNDFNPSNLLVGDDGALTGIIDFGDVLEAPRICDLATAIAYQEPEAGLPALISQALADYCRHVELRADEITVLPLLVRARAAMVAAIAHWRAASQPDNREYLLRNVPLASRLLQAAAS